MENCQPSGAMTGRMSNLTLAYGCADVVPDAEDFKFFGTTTSRGTDFSPSTVTSDADNGSGYVETLVTTADLTISVDYEVNLADGSDEIGFHSLVAYFNKELQARRQPSIWVRRNVGATVITAYMNITSLSESGGTNDLITGSMEFKPAKGSTVDVMSILDLTLTTDVPATLSVASGAALTIPAVIPVGGVAPYTYQWRKGGAVIAGATNASYTKTGAAAADAGTYTVTVTDSATIPDFVVSRDCVVTVGA